MKTDTSGFPHPPDRACEPAVRKVSSGGKSEKNTAALEPLVRRMCRGDYDAYEEIYLYSIENLTAFLTLLFNSRYEAEEAAQETFIYVWEHREKIDPGKNFKGFLYTVAKRMAFRQMARNKLEQKYYEHKSHIAQDYELSPDELMINEELAILIALYIENMPAQRKRVFEMSRKEGKTIEEIAGELNISYNTVKNHLQKGMNGLREFITLFMILFIS